MDKMDFIHLLIREDILLNNEEVGDFQVNFPKLEINFVPSQHIYKDPTDDRSPYAVKVNRLIQLRVTKPEFFDDRWILIGLFHSHPSYAQNIIRIGNTIKKTNKSAPPLHSPIECLNNSETHYRLVTIPDIDIPLVAVLTKVHQGMIDLSFPLVSTDPDNHGKLKEAKEWQALFCPLTEISAQEILCSPMTQSFTLRSDTLAAHCTVRIQVREEIRKNVKLGKNHRTNEVRIPLRSAQSGKTQLLEELWAIAKKLSNEDIKKLRNIGQQMHNDSYDSYNANNIHDIDLMGQQFCF